jgi:hypothetical protein
LEKEIGAGEVKGAKGLVREYFLKKNVKGCK